MGRKDIMREYLIIYSQESKRYSVVISAKNQEKAVKKFRDRYGEDVEIEMIAMKLVSLKGRKK